MNIVSRGTAYDWVSIVIENGSTQIQEDIDPREAEILRSELLDVIDDLNNLIRESKEKLDND